MGCYVNPTGISKEDWLLKHGEPTIRPIKVSETHVPVCLVDNGYFTAAAVGFNDKEAEDFNDPSDRRPKLWFSVPREMLYDVSDLKDWEERLARNAYTQRSL